MTIVGSVDEGLSLATTVTSHQIGKDTIKDPRVIPSHLGMSRNTIIKLLGSALMLFLVLRRIDFSKLYDSLAGITWLPLTIMGLVYLGGQLISSYKWHLIVTSGDDSIPYLRTLRAYFLGMFVNMVGVGTIGGDMTRAIVLSASDYPKGAAFASVVADRIQGLFVLSMIGIFAIFFLDGLELAPYFSYAIMILALGLMVGWFLTPWILLHVLPTDHRWHKKLEDAIAVFPRSPTTILQITALSAVFHCSQICLHGYIASALGASVPWAALFAAVPFVNIASSLPVSLQGLGVRENAYRFFLVPAFLSIEQAVALGTLWFYSMTVAGLIGGLAAWLSRPASAE